MTTVNELFKNTNQSISKDLLVFSDSIKTELEKSGLPHRRIEDWKYTSLNSFFEESKENGQSISTSINESDFDILELEDGKIVAAPDYIEVEKIESTQDLDLQKNYFEQDFSYKLNLATLDNAFNIRITKTCEKPLLVKNFSDNSINILINFYVAKYTKLDILQVHTNNKAKLTTVTQNFNLEEGAVINHTVLQNNNHQCYSLLNNFSQVCKHASYNQVIIHTGSRLVRSNLYHELKEPEAFCSAHGLYVLDNNQHADTMSYIYHNAPHTNSEQLYKSVLADKSRGIFTGRVRVEKDAQLINAEQLNKNLLLSNKAQAYSRPQLEIYADDVKCSHGSTTGQLSESELFYFESRGIKTEKARQMLAKAFVNDVVLKIDNLKIRNIISEIISLKKVNF